MPHKFSPTPLFRNVIVTDGGTVQINSAGNDKNIQIYHDDTNSIIKTSSGALYLQPGNNTIYGYDGTATYAFALYAGAALGVMLHGGGNCYINNSNNFGVGLTDPDELVEFYKVGTQLKLSGGAADYATFAVSAAGALTITTVDADAALGHIVLMPDGFVGVGTTPASILHALSASAEIRLADSSATGNPFYSLYQQTTNVGYLQYDDGANMMQVANLVAGGGFRVLINGGAAYGMTIDSSGNAGFGVSTFGTNATKVLGISADGTVPSTSPAGMIQIFADDSSDGAANATLAIRTEQAVEAAGVTTDARLQIWINGVEYYLGLEVV